MSRAVTTFVFAAMLLFSTYLAWAHSYGMTGVTNKTGGAGCYCHSGSSLPIVTLTGPASLSVGQTGTYTLTISSGTLIGCDIAASSGTLAPKTTGLQLLSGEITHSYTLSGTSVQFNYTPTVAGAETLYAVGARDSKSGGWGHAPNLPVTVNTGKTSDVQVQESPLTYALHQNYPNPFNPSTTIRFDLPVQAFVRLTVYNLLGEEVAVPVNGVCTAGRQNVRFLATNLPSGAYLYRLEATPLGNGARFVETRKFVLVR